MALKGSWIPYGFFIARVLKTRLRGIMLLLFVDGFVDCLKLGAPPQKTALCSGRELRHRQHCVQHAPKGIDSRWGLQHIRMGFAIGLFGVNLLTQGSRSLGFGALGVPPPPPVKAGPFGQFQSRQLGSHSLCKVKIPAGGTSQDRRRANQLVSFLFGSACPSVLNPFVGNGVRVVRWPTSQ